MNGLAIFLDTGVLAAFHNVQDPSYSTARQILGRVVEHQFGSAYTSDYVVDEGTTLIFARTKNRRLSDIFLNDCLNSSEAFDLLKISGEDVLETAKEYLRHDDLSFTDCSSLVLMRKHGIKHIATFDKGFQKVKGVSVVSQ